MFEYVWLAILVGALLALIAASVLLDRKEHHEELRDDPRQDRN